MHNERGVQWLSSFNIISGPGYIFALFLLVIYFKIGAEGAIFSALAPLLIKQILIFYYLHKKMNLGFSYGSFALTRQLAIYGITSFLGNLMLATAFRADSFIINFLLGSASLGIYSVAVNLAELTLMIPAAIGVALFPHLTSENESDRIRISSDVARLSICFGLFSALFLAVFGYPIIYIIFGQLFISAYQPLLAFLPGLVAMTAVFAYTNYFSSIGRPIYIAYVFGVGIIINSSLNFLVIPHFGIIGAATVASISYFIIMVIFIALITKITQVHWSSLLIPRMNDFNLIREKLNGLISNFR
jgi:O-antigen/teichoic acid export membrane protein